ncbi:unnamed protein product [Caenorhabditis brenneri]
MPNKKNVVRHALLSLEDQKQAEFILKEEFRKTAGGTLGQELITPLVMEGNEDTALQNPHISQNAEHPGLNASILELAESNGGSAVHSQAAASHSSWTDTKRGVSAKESSSHATSAGSYSYRFQCQTIHSAPTSQFLSMKNCLVAPQEQVLGDTETAYTGSIGHTGCSNLEGMQNFGPRSYDETQSAHYNQLQNLGGLSIKQSGGAKTPSDEPVAVTNYFDSMNGMHQEIGNGSDGVVTEKNVPVGNQSPGIQPTTQDLQGIYENYENSSSHNIGKVQRDSRLRHSVEPYTKMTKKARDLLKKKQIEEQLAFVDDFHGICPKLVYIPAFSTIQENENLTPPSPTWPGK